MKILIYDLEIIRCIPQKGVNLGEFYEMCGGWDDFPNMGISVIGFCDWDCTPLALEWAHPATREIFSVFAHQATIVGFNSMRFDDNLMRVNGHSITTEYDLLEEVRIAAYGSPRYQDQPKGACYSLDAIAKANGMAKTGSGALAPQLWQQGKKQEVIDYCARDVEITRSLLKLGLEGKLRDPNTDKFLRLPPLEVK